MRREGCADVRDRRFSRGRIQRGQLNRHIRLRRIEEIVDRLRARTHLRLLAQAAVIDRSPVPQRVNACNGKGKFPVLLPQEARQGAPHIAIPDECELH